MSERYPGGLITKTPVTPSGPYGTNTAPGVWTLDQAMQAQKAGNWPVVGGPYDQYFDYVTLLLHGDGTNGAQNNTFLDSSSNNFTITRNGNTTQGSFSPYGSNWGNYFNGSSYIQLASSSALNMNTYCCLEAWVNYSALSSSTLIIGRDSSYWLGYDFSGIGGSATKFVFTIYNGSSWQAVSSTTSPSIGVWYHIAGIKDNGTLRIYINGVQENTSTFSGTPVTSATVFGIASNQNTQNTTGYISNARLNLGATSAVLPYTSNFTPSTTPLTAISGTSLLTCQSNRFIDNSSNNFALTVNGTPSVQRFSPFAPTSAYSTATIGGSGYFDGSGDSLSLSSTSLNLGANDFTVECWFYTGTTTEQAVVGSIQNSNGAGSWFFDTNYTGKLRFFCRYAGGTVLDYNVGTGNLGDNTWHHIAATRSGANLRLFLDGVQLGTTNTTLGASAIDNAVTNYYVGRTTDGASYLNGYISNLRVVIGTALYTTAFTPPTAPLTAVTNTSLLLNMTNGAIYDNAMMNDLETVGNAQISTAVKKYGTGSMAFDGTGDALVGKPSDVNIRFGTGDFTVEGWFYQTVDNTYPSALEIGNHLGASGILFITKTSGVACIYSGGFYGSIATTLNTWNHIAWVRQSGVLKIFVNGVSSTPVAFTNDLTDTATYYIGAEHSLNAIYTFNGYIDDLRITKGVARYTTAFTPPTAAFPNQ